VEGIRYRNLTMKNVRFPVSITSYYPKPPAHPSQDQPAQGNAFNPVWRDISIENLKVTDSKNSIILWGLPDEPVTGVKMKNVTMATQAGSLVFHAKGIEFSNVALRPAKGPVLRYHDARIQGLEGEECDDKPVKFK
jgi:polygalacturonase